MIGRRARIHIVVGLTLGLWLLTVPPAHAYIDPGTGSIVIQAVAAGAMAVALTGRLMWRRLKGFFARITGRPIAETEVEPATEASTES
jgi:hypothetical protein